MVLDRLCYDAVIGSEIERSEIAEKEMFRMQIEQLIRQVIAQHEEEQAQRTGFPSLSVELKCFGSLASGFATKDSDMDLALLSPLSAVQPDAKNSPIPRLLEKALLGIGMGARLLTRTRVPIIKLCQHPPEALYRNLVAQRELWESGLENETHESNEEDEQEHEVRDAVLDGDEESHGEVPRDKNGVKVATEFEIPSADGSEPRRLYLRQGPGSSLDSYYGTAKRVLRKAGGRDVRAPTVHNFPNDQWEILNRVCQAFVRGLSDNAVRQRLETFSSLSFQPAPNMLDRHSLSTTYTQIQGEHAIHRWRAWLGSKGMAEDPQGSQAVEAWHIAQNKPTYGSDPVLFNKELQALFDNIKKTPSVQLACLEQGSEESPTQYHRRAASLLSTLLDTHVQPPRALEATVTEQYIAGIHRKEIQSAVAEYAKSLDGTLSLQAVSLRHKALQLAREFTRALDKDLYSPIQAEEIRAYVQILNSAPISKPTTQNHAGGDLVVPVRKSLAPLVAKVRTLQDPHLLAPNQTRYKDHLEFPKSGAGVQCDINFSAHLALQNTALLRCYSHTDPRVRPMVLFIKRWAKLRGINSGYRGTLSSYGYVLMVIHYLVNVAQPFVCPNLQNLAPPVPANLSQREIESNVNFRGYDIQFWRNEEEIIRLASMNQLTRNTTSIGGLLRGFFEYFAQTGPMSSGSGRGFDWGRDALSLRTQGGLVSKQSKGWTGAKTIYEVQGGNGGAGPTVDPAGTSTSNGLKAPADTEVTSTKPTSKGDDVKEVRLRYLFAIEDPFETDHNVARTVTHNGIVAIRDEFRRAWRIIKGMMSGESGEDLLQDASKAQEDERASIRQLMDEIHGNIIFDDDD